MLRIGIYPRKSVYRDNSDSVQVQITACKDYARLMFKDQELDFRIYDKDEGFSGKNTNRPSFTEGAKALGSWIAQNGHTLVYGGSRTGLMGATADAVLAGGGKVIGVIPDVKLIQERRHPGLTECIETKDMAERKTKMIQLGDAFIAFPGGTGTLEEIAEVMSKVSLKQLDVPCILYNLNGYYDHLKALLAHMTDMGLSTPERQEGIYFADNLDEIRTILKI